MTEEPELKVCGQLAHATFRRKARKESIIFTSCCDEPGHTGNHVFGVYYLSTVSDPPVLDFVEEVKRDRLKRVVHCDMRPGSPLSEQEIQALWQYFEYRRELQAAEREGT